MNRDRIILIFMILMTAAWSLTGQAAEPANLNALEIELESESRGLNFQKEIAKQEGQFRVVAKSINGEEAGAEESLESDNDPLTVTLIKAR